MNTEMPTCKTEKIPSLEMFHLVINGKSARAIVLSLIEMNHQINRSNLSQSIEMM